MDGAVAGGDDFVFILRALGGLRLDDVAIAIGRAVRIRYWARNLLEPTFGGLSLKGRFGVLSLWTTSNPVAKVSLRSERPLLI